VALAPDLIIRAGPNAVPYTYELGNTEVMVPRGIFAHFDGSAAGGQFLPCVSFYAASGQLMSRAFPSQALAAGASADVSYFPW
jgi:hypothetical protein